LTALSPPLAGEDLPKDAVNTSLYAPLRPSALIAPASRWGSWAGHPWPAREALTRSTHGSAGFWEVFSGQRL